MPLHTNMVGRTTAAITHSVDARWLMSYAAGLGDFNPRYLDTRNNAVVAHPLFPVALEWPVILTSRKLPGYELATAAEAARGVHAAHDLHLYRPIVAGDQLTTQATIISLRAIKPGAAQVSRLDTFDASGHLVSRTYQLGISRHVEVIGEAVALEEPPAPPRLTAPWAQPVRDEILVAEGAAHIYTECARIWNPIHTDRAVALGAGLPDIILHGTATLAMAVSRLVNRRLNGDPTRVRRIGGRFTAMVRMPCTLTLELRGDAEQTLYFDVLTQDGQKAFSDGFLCYA